MDVANYIDKDEFFITYPIVMGSRYSGYVLETMECVDSPFRGISLELVICINPDEEIISYLGENMHHQVDIYFNGRVFNECFISDITPYYVSGTIIYFSITFSVNNYIMLSEGEVPGALMDTVIRDRAIDGIINDD